MYFRKYVNGEYIDMTEAEAAEIMDANTPRNIGYTAADLSSMTNAELEQILAGYGMTASPVKANLVKLILYMQDMQGGDADA